MIKQFIQVPQPTAFVVATQNTGNAGEMQDWINGLPAPASNPTQNSQGVSIDLASRAIAIPVNGSEIVVAPNTDYIVFSFNAFTIVPKAEFEKANGVYTPLV